MKTDRFRLISMNENFEETVFEPTQQLMSILKLKRLKGK
jgi:hypothetical protein